MQGFFFAESKNGEKNVMKCADGVKNKIRPLFAGFYDSLMFSYFDGVSALPFATIQPHPRRRSYAAATFILPQVTKALGLICSNFAAITKTQS